MVGLMDYVQNPYGYSGFGIDNTLTGENAVALAKALEAGYAVSGQTGGNALQVQSLESALKITTWAKARQFPFWAKAVKSPTYSTVAEWNTASSWGAQTGGFVRQTEVPPEQDGTYTRNTANVKFIATTGSVTHVLANIFPAHGDVKTLKVRERMLWMLQRINHHLYKGDSALVFTGEGEEWDGLDVQIAAASVRDLEGNPMTQPEIELGAQQILDNFGFPTDLLLSTRAVSDFDKTLMPKERIMVPLSADGMVGLSAKGVNTSAGPIVLNPDIFLGRTFSAPSPPAAATSTQAPAAAASVTTALSGTDGDFNKGFGGGQQDFGFAVTMSNRFGESATTFVAANQAMTQANKDLLRHIDLTITNAAVIGTFPPEHVNIYRTRGLAAGAAVSTDVADYSLIMRVAVGSQAPAGTTTPDDVNLILAFTEQAYMGSLDQEVFELLQLLPFIKADLAFTSLAYRFVLACYMVPVLYGPAKWLRYINIGQL